MERTTNQKALILDYLKSVKTHPKAEDIYSSVKKTLPHLSLGTVYRNLRALTSQGIIQEIQADSAHYDGDTSPHAHYICQSCGHIYDLFDCCYLLKNKKTKVGNINQYRIYLYGNCKKCCRK